MIKARVLNKLRRVSGIHEVIQRLFVIEENTKDLKQQVAQLSEQNRYLAEKVAQTVDLLVADRDDIATLRNKLYEVRTSNEYRLAYTKKQPLVTVRIATFNKADELMNRCLPSVLNQTYKNIEVIVVGDHCTDDTEERIKELNDHRVTFVNFDRRSMYPEEKKHRWFVAGSPGMNYGVELAKGDWIAPIDDDDEFTLDHVEKLIKLARKTKAELVYGALRQINQTNGEERTLFSSPPMLGQFSFQAAIYPRALRFLRYDEQSWVVREPGDWNLCRRMLMCGVTTATTEDIVGHLYMHNLEEKKHYRDK